MLDKIRIKEMLFINNNNNTIRNRFVREFRRTRLLLQQYITITYVLKNNGEDNLTFCNCV